ncbi:hypothetical protein LCGC14_1889330 [marine sediment metagenome]|uniref:Uncharacterized protein n=1 Tax=marine sediment metagenome TaxID=412755 RepID=A0A0F9IY48_9ZZZZ
MSGDQHYQTICRLISEPYGRADWDNCQSCTQYKCPIVGLIRRTTELERLVKAMVKDLSGLELP